jgi:hypothetical protein
MAAEVSASDSSALVCKVPVDGLLFAQPFAVKLCFVKLSRL